MESRSRLEIREWSYDNLDLVSPGESKKNNSQYRLHGLLTVQVGTGCARWTTGAFHHTRVAAPRRSVSTRGLGQSEF